MAVSTQASVVFRNVSPSLRSLSASFPCSVQLLRRFFTGSYASDKSSRLIRLNDFSIDNMDADMFVRTWLKFFDTFGISSSLSRSPGWSSNKAVSSASDGRISSKSKFLAMRVKVSTDTQKLRGQLNNQSACAHP